LQQERIPNDVEVLSAEVLSVHKAMPADGSCQRKAEPASQHKSTHVQNAAISTDTVLQHDLLNEAISTDIPVDSVLQATPASTIQEHHDPIPTDDVLKEQVIPANDELRPKVTPSDAGLSVCNVLENEAVSDGAMIKCDIAVDNDDLLQSEVCGSESKEGPECTEEQRVNTGTAESEGEISHNENKMDSETSTVGGVGVCVQKETDSVRVNISDETKPGDSQTVDDHSALDAVQSAQLPAPCPEAGRTVEPSAVNVSDDASECYNIHNVQNRADVDRHSSCKEPTEGRSITGKLDYNTPEFVFIIRFVM